MSTFAYVMTSIFGTIFASIAAYIYKNRSNFTCDCSCTEDNCTCSVESIEETRKKELEMVKEKAKGEAKEEDKDQINSMKELYEDELKKNDEIVLLLMDKEKEIKQLNVLVDDMQNDYDKFRNQYFSNIRLNGLSAASLSEPNTPEIQNSKHCCMHSTKDLRM